MDLLSLLALLFAASFPLFLPVWCSLMDANGHLLNWISSQDGDKRGTAPPSPLYPSYFEPCSVQRCVERTLMRRSKETPPLLDSFKTLCSRLALTHRTMREGSCMGPHVQRCLYANLVKCLLVMQLGNYPIKKHPHRQLRFW